VNATFSSARGLVITRLDPEVGAEITGTVGLPLTDTLSSSVQLNTVKSPAIKINKMLIFFISDSF
jgi:hypothetical protein